MPRNENRVLAGHVDVDAGLVWIGDPCYVFGDDASSRVRDWGKFCDSLRESGHDVGDAGFSTPLGAGVGIASSTGFGDGGYPVYVTYSDEGRWGKRVAKIEVIFIGHELEEE